MVRILAVLALLISASSGCGPQTGAGATDGPASPATPRPTATWPPPGCTEMSGGSFDYAALTGGSPTLQRAALEHVPEGVSVVRAPPPGPHEQRLWWVVDASGVVVAALGVVRGDDGTWLVDYEERCSR